MKGKKRLAIIAAFGLALSVVAVIWLRPVDEPSFHFLKGASRKTAPRIDDNHVYTSFFTAGQGEDVVTAARLELSEDEGWSFQRTGSTSSKFVHKDGTVVVVYWSARAGGEMGKPHNIYIDVSQAGGPSERFISFMYDVLPE